MIHSVLTSPDTKGATGTQIRLASEPVVERLFEYCIIDAIEETCALVLRVYIWGIRGYMCIRGCIGERLR